MTASIMSAVPPRRAGAGSAMNDATRELGAALGVAVLGSVAASRYGAQIAPALTRPQPADQTTATQLDRRCAQRGVDAAAAPAGDALTTAAHAARSSRHPPRGASSAPRLAVAQRRASCTATCRTRSRRRGALHGPLESLEEVAELGLGGVPPVFADGTS